MPKLKQTSNSNKSKHRATAVPNSNESGKEVWEVEWQNKGSGFKRRI